MSLPEGSVYLGDGVYAIMENGMVRLFTYNGISVDNTVYLEESVFIALQDFAKKGFGL